ncbi:MAG TPA: DUF4384 domain-containing protein [Kofleriaceae bacterium]|nr:DUF4384 domain-containing protein [Kofleriaceae bacterium]
MKSSSSLSLAFVIAVACGGGASTPAPVSPAPRASPASRSPAAPVTAAPADDAVSVTFQAFAAEGAGRRALAPGETLRSGDQVTMELTVDRAAYAYVLQFFADGSATVLFPHAAEDNRVSGTTRVPPTGWFQLDDTVGEETVYVVASTRPLAQVDASVLAVVDEVRRTGVAPPPDASPADAPPPTATPLPASGRPPAATRPRPRPVPHGAGAGAATGGAAPGRASLRTRGFVRVDDTSFLKARTDDDGLAVFSVSFQHVAKASK